MKLVFLGKLADLAGRGEFELGADGAIGWDALLERLDAPLAEALRGDKVRVAHNGEVLADKATLIAGPGDEVAFLPPVSGG